MSKLEANKGRWLFGVTVLFILSIAAAATFSEQKVRSSRESSVSKVPKSIAHKFSLFRSPSEGLPSFLIKRLGPPPFAANWSLAESLHMDVWAVPARKHICLVKQRPEGEVAVTCTETERVLTHGIFTASLKDQSIQSSGPRREIIGLAPDKTRAVQLITPNFRTITVEVNHNVFVQRDNIPASPQTVKLLR